MEHIEQRQSPSRIARLKELLACVECNRKRTVTVMLTTGFGIGFAVGMLVTTISIYAVQYFK